MRTCRDYAHEHFASLVLHEKHPKSPRISVRSRLSSAKILCIAMSHVTNLRPALPCIPGMPSQHPSDPSMFRQYGHIIREFLVLGRPELESIESIVFEMLFHTSHMCRSSSIRPVIDTKWQLQPYVGTVCSNVHPINGNYTEPAQSELKVERKKISSSHRWLLHASATCPSHVSEK